MNNKQNKIIEKEILKKIKIETAKEIRNDSRKYKLALLIFAAATIMCLFPPLIAVFVFKTAPLIVLSGEAWVTVMGMLGGFYFGANILQKKFVQDAPAQNKDEQPKEDAQIEPEQVQKIENEQTKDRSVK